MVNRSEQRVHKPSYLQQYGCKNRGAPLADLAVVQPPHAHNSPDDLAQPLSAGAKEHT